jgi:hypothetical protein
VDEQAPNSDHDEWLAEAIGATPEAVAAATELGDRRRAFVAEELLEAGIRGTLLLEFVMRLTGTDEAGAAALVDARIHAHASDEHKEPPPRDRRLAQNEILFRLVNEQLARRAPTEPIPEEIDLVCECSDRACSRRLTMRFGEYEWLRQNPWRFVVLPGHEAPAIEDVVERYPGHVIVEKHDETHHLVEEATNASPPHREPRDPERDKLRAK